MVNNIEKLLLLQVGYVSFNMFLVIVLLANGLVIILRNLNKQMDNSKKNTIFVFTVLAAILDIYCVMFAIINLYTMK